MRRVGTLGSIVPVISDKLLSLVEKEDRLVVYSKNGDMNRRFAKELAIRADGMHRTRIQEDTEDTLTFTRGGKSKQLVLEQVKNSVNSISPRFDHIYTQITKPSVVGLIELTVVYVDVDHTLTLEIYNIPGK